MLTLLSVLIILCTIQQVLMNTGLSSTMAASSYVTIKFCPWCGNQLPQSKRDQWFEELAALGFDSPLDQDIPEQYKSNSWYQQT